MQHFHEQYWGKSNADGDFHLLPFHCLDVAACGVILLQRHDQLRRRLSDRLGIAESALIAWAGFLLCLHDIGKFSYRFQGLKPDFAGLSETRPAARRYSVRHDTLGWHLWLGALEAPAMKRFIPESLPQRSMRAALRTWIGTSVGHHGQPPDQDPLGFRLVDHFTTIDQQAAVNFMEACGCLMLSTTELEIADAKSFAKAIKRNSWWLAGISVLCDWLGSNADLFPFSDDAIPLDQYWHEHALPAARKAIDHSGVLPLTVPARSQSDLFDYLATPTPLQRLAETMSLSQEPQLLILEDVTGSGKTEAAVTLAHRIQASGAADGVYLALPTMATSNAMHARVVGKDLHKRLFAGEPSVVLTHGAARLMQDEPPRNAVLPDGPLERDYDGDETSAANLRSAWLCDHRKKALLADLGVGTVDQALLAILPSRHQSLRLLGLARKVLVVDEVHAYDAYMQILLEALLRFQASIGGQVVLLSATLPQTTRQALADAYRAGLGRDPVATTATDYPLLTRVDATGSEEIPVETRPEVKRSLPVQLVGDTQSAIDTLLDTHRTGHCGCWVRNTVNDAIEAWQALHDAGVPMDRLDLFHARFALGDRLEIEAKALANFGPESGPETRQGRILIATQVVEQSLDLDFDVMVTDLAPIDLVIQRAGRLRRHCRDTTGKRTESEQRGEPLLHVLSPPPDQDADAEWLAALIPKSAAVYQDLGNLWRTALLLQQHGAIRMPDDARTLIEGVYGEDAEALPAGLEPNSGTAEGKTMADRSIGRFNALPLEKGYMADDMEYWDDIIAPTRLGEPSVRVRLARWHEGRLAPWRPDDRHAWAMSEVSLRMALFADEADHQDPVLKEEIKQYLESVPDKGRWSRLLPLEEVAPDVWEGDGLNGRGEPVRFRYQQTTGLLRVSDE